MFCRLAFSSLHLSVLHLLQIFQFRSFRRLFRQFLHKFDIAVVGSGGVGVVAVVRGAGVSPGEFGDREGLGTGSGSGSETINTIFKV